MQVSVHFAQGCRFYWHVLRTADTVSLMSLAMRAGMSTDSGERQLRWAGAFDAVHPAAKHCNGEKGTNGLVVSEDTKDTCARAFCPVTVESRNVIG